MKKIKKYFTPEIISMLLLGVILIQPIIDLDYLIYPFFEQIGLPLFSTIINYLLIPLVIALIFFSNDKHKLRTFILVASYGIVLLVYFYFHNKMAIDLDGRLFLPPRFSYSLVKEFEYIVTLLIPFGILYAVSISKINQKMFIKFIVCTSLIISLPIIFGNLTLTSPSTYEGFTRTQFFNWFTWAYDVYHPRELATQFWFSEGNTIGVVLFMIYPVLIYSLYKSENKLFLNLVIFFQSLAMYMLATRVATFGVPLMLFAVTMVYLLLLVLRKVELNYKFLISVFALFMIFFSMIKFTPAYVNQQIDAENDGLVLKEDYQRDAAKGLAENNDLQAGSLEYLYFYIHIFEDYHFLLTIPNVYYLEWYSYKDDPKFWVDFTLELPLYERVSGRKFQKIFFDYKMGNLNYGENKFDYLPGQVKNKEKLFGFGYSRFMNGSILLEQDFIMQYYTYGILGFIMFSLPWIALLALIAILTLINFKKIDLFKVAVVGMGICGGLLSAYLSGHVLDQFMSSIVLALLMGYLLKYFKEV